MKESKLIIEGNGRQVDKVVHELQKFVSEADKLPEVTVSLQTRHIEDADGLDIDAAFTDGGSHE